MIGLTNNLHYQETDDIKVEQRMVFSALKVERLKQLRQERGYTQAYMAQQLGVRQPQYADWERSRNQPGGEVVARMAAILDVTLDFLYGLVDHPDERLKEEGLTELEAQIIREIRKDEIKRQYVLKLLDLPSQPALPASNETTDRPHITSRDTT